MESLLSYLGCFPIRSTSNHDLNDEKPKSNTNPLGQYALNSEKKKIMSVEEASATILSILQNAEKAGKSLDIAVQDIATQAGGWRERLAIAVLTALLNALKGGTPFQEAMSGAYQKASDAAAGIADFAREHPLYAAAVCAVVALGILMILAPYIIHALGFGVMGPVEGSWAAAWQSVYGGVVESGSLFSYLQKLGMLYK